MKKTREEKKTEAIKRMKKMGVFKPTIKQFADSDLVSASEPPVGAFYWLDDEEKKMVQEFEENHNALVYMVIRSFTTLGKMDSLLFVSDYPEEWKMDMEDLDNNLALAYVVNHDMPDCSEMGSIGWKLTIAGGLQRTA